MRLHYTLGTLVTSLLLTLLTSSVAAANSFTFTKIVDTNTPIPGGTGKFSLFGTPAIDGGNVAFSGNGSSNQRGIYTVICGSLTVVADTNTPIPGGTRNFFGFNSFTALDDGNVAFKAIILPPQPSEAPVVEGIYSNIGGSLNVAADPNTPIPNGAGNFSYFLDLALNDGNVVFSGSGSSSQQGIYNVIGGLLNVVADTNTAIPNGTGNFQRFDAPPAIDSGNVVFSGSGSSNQQGIYTAIGGLLNVVADTNTLVPGGTGNFSRFVLSPALNGKDVAFSGTDSSNRQGIYTANGSSLNVVADTSTPIPGGTGNFSLFLDLAFDHGKVAFRGTGSSNQEGIYTNIGGPLSKVIDQNDSLDGKLVRSLVLGRQGLSGNTIAFTAQFTDNSSGIFRAALSQDKISVVSHLTRICHKS